MKQSRIEEIAAKSLVNCHARGVDSILFDDTPEARVRVFIANSNHELWKNDVTLAHEFSVGLHPHHCDLILEPIYGMIGNVVLNDGGKSILLHKYEYQSAISGPTGRFVDTGEWSQWLLAEHQLQHPEKMGAAELHTVFVPKGKEAAWLVREGKEDPQYEAVCYSNAPLENFDFTGMYEPMKVSRLLNLVAKYELTKYV